MKLSDLISYDSITIQCHDNPYADAIASVFALYTYFQSKKMQLFISFRGIITERKSLQIEDTVYE